LHSGSPAASKSGCGNSRIADQALAICMSQAIEQLNRCRWQLGLPKGSEGEFDKPLRGPWMSRVCFDNHGISSGDCRREIAA
jgi:hypothetical protein